jgi:hypothetical protein
MAGNAKAKKGNLVLRRSDPVEFPRFLMLADLAVIDGEFFAPLQVP